MMTLGVHSEVGRLREVMVHRPDLSLRRLTPDNCKALLFDDVLWVKRARQEHDAFVDTLRERGVLVHSLGELLAETMDNADARQWLLSLRVKPPVVGEDMVAELRAWLGEMPSGELSTYLVGGIARAELPFEPMGLSGRALAPQDFVLPPLPNQLFTRDSSCWVYGGVSVNSMYWQARRPEAANVEAIYRFHPRFRGNDFPIFSSDGDEAPSLEGGDVMPVGNGVVLIGMGERTTPQAVSALAGRLFTAGLATRVIAALMPRDRSFMHLDTVFTFCDRDLVTLYPPVVNRLRSFRCALRMPRRSLISAKRMHRSPRSSPTPWGSRPCASCRPVATGTRRNANSGTMATTSSPSSPAWSSPMTATSIPTRFCAVRASR